MLTSDSNYIAATEVSVLVALPGFRDMSRAPASERQRLE